MSDAEIYHYLLGPFVVNGMYNAPAALRPNDTNPSFGVYEGHGKLLWHDFGGGEVSGDKAINLLMEMRNVSYRDALHIVKTEIANHRMGRPPITLRKTTLRGKLPFITYRSHRDYELEYWHKFGQNEADLQYENIFALDQMSYKNSDFKFESKPHDPAFVYVYNTSPLSCKLYRPYNDANKFRTFNTEGVIEGWSQMMTELKKRGKPFTTLYINSSTKDRVVWKKEISGDCGAINPRSEGIFREIIQKKDEINSLALNINVIFDADNTGYEKSKLLAERCDWKYTDLRNKLGWDQEKQKPIKDIARLRELDSSSSAISTKLASVLS